MRRALTWLTAGTLAAAVIWTAGTVPPPAVPLGSTPGLVPPRSVVRGAYHVHSTESDGTASVAGIAEAARIAGLDFVILTDHGDGRRPIRPPRYYGGVLCIEAIEISTDDGHYAALGLDTPPYRLAGDGRDVAEDVQRLGGFGIVAHPDSAKPGLQWKEWNMPVGGFEWFNADSQWRDEGRVALVQALAHYLFRKPESVAALFDRPVDALRHWDELTTRGRVVGMAAADAHARLGLGGGVDPYEDGLYLPVPSYEAVFRAFSLQVELDSPFGGSAVEDARRLIAAVRGGRVTTTFDALAAPATVIFEGEAAGEWAGPGGELPRVTPIRFHVRTNAPPGATIVMLRAGEVVHESAGASASWETMLAGAFRAEVRLPNAPGTPPVPWAVTNPIYVGVPPGPPGPPPLPPPASSTPFPRGGWAVERDAASRGSVQILSPEGAPVVAVLAYELGPLGESSPYVAAVTHEVGALAGADRLMFQASATRPMRLSIQLRAGDGTDRRWRRSVFLDQTVREVTVAFSELRGIADARGQELVTGQVSSLLFVIDTVNAAPGDAGAVTLVDVRAGRR